MSSHGANAYYPWYVRDYRSSRKVQRMGWLARGLYRELLDEEFMEGSLPNSIEALADICSCPVKVMEKAWKELRPCFEEVDGRLINPKLEQIRTDKDLIRVKRAEAGRLGGIAKQEAALASKSHIAEQSKAEQRKQFATPSPSEETPTQRQAFDEFLTAWNENRGDLPKVSALSSDRQKKLQTRVRGGLTIEQFTEAVKLCASSPFLTGSNDRRWRAGFDWLIENESNLLKVLEGQYANSGGAPRAAAQAAQYPPGFFDEPIAQAVHRV